MIDNKKQEEILLSVLPKQIAIDVRKNIDRNPKKNTMFHKIYIRKHDNIRFVYFTKTKNYIKQIFFFLVFYLLIFVILQVLLLLVVLKI